MLSDLAEYLALAIPEVEGRVYPLVIRQDDELPAITYRQESRTVPMLLSGGTLGCEQTVVEVVVWSREFAECEAIAVKILAAVEPLAGRLGGTAIDCVSVEDTGPDEVDEIPAADDFVFSRSSKFWIQSQITNPPRLKRGSLFATAVQAGVEL